MKKLVRKFCFETNSSSSHSIALAGEDKQFIFDTLYPNQNGVITLTGGEFGWEWFKHNDAQTKADYAAQALGNDDNLIDVIKEQTGALEVIINTEHGYIDHDSYGIVPRDKEGLRNFIFNKNSWLFGGNDNETPDPTFYQVPEIRDGKMILPEYKYELVIEGLSNTTKFLKKPTKEELENGIEALIGRKLMYDNGTFMDDDMMSNIFFQINRRNDMFEKSWHVEQDYSKKYILMTRENSVYPIEQKLKDEGKFEGLNWKERSALVKKEVLKNKYIHRKVKFTLKKI